MVALNKAAVQATRMVVRVAELHARQTPGGEPHASPVSPASDMPASTTEGESTATENRDHETGPHNAVSPLVFFVALGLVVIFASLWIVIAVKTYVRCNAGTQQTLLPEGGDPVVLEPQPQHQRGQEKRLITMDEVDGKFPIMKYKNWVSSRAKQVLHQEVGVLAPASRANSVRSLEGRRPESLPREMESHEQQLAATSKHKIVIEIVALGDIGAIKEAGRDQELVTTPSDAGDEKEDAKPVTTDREQISGISTGNEQTTADAQRINIGDEDEKEVNVPLPVECEGPGDDTCAICMDTLEDDDDIRGLTCGHAFHTACADPWLTIQRACCPLCKADFYTPEPIPSSDRS